MKKKFVLTSALVLIVVASLVAATPIEVSGSFKAGYKFTFGDDDPGVTHVDGNETNIKATFAGDFWEVALAGGSDVLFGNEQAVDATAKIFLSKALAEEGVDLGDFAVTLHVGNGVGKDAASVFADKGGYKKHAVAMAKKQNFGITLGYAKLVEVYFAAYPDKDFNMVVSAKATPIDGVSVAVGYSNEADAINASAKFDIKELVDLDVDSLVVSAGYRRGLTSEANDLGADVVAGLFGATLWVAYQTDFTGHALKADASYKHVIEGFELTAGVNVAFADLAADDIDTTVALRAGASKGFGGATYALNLGYKVNGDFTLTPSVAINF